ncbi:unnamed protein product [Rhizoctonia solani]|uniref:Uncharacterized protein n=1 Tax=Rhizoctonia solani TaxID=456999 RepID=A0A8H2WFP9_9AGAM|nr:unnamed protein product [Rhizoctonia solani]
MSTGGEPYDIRERGYPEQTIKQKEAESSPPSFEGLRAEFEQQFTSKKWRGAQNLSSRSTNRRALVIGVNYGNRRPPGGLTGTSVDALRVIKMLETFGYKPTDICVLADITIPTTSFGIDLEDDDDAESRLPKRINIGSDGLRPTVVPGSIDFCIFLDMAITSHTNRALLLISVSCRKMLNSNHFKIAKVAFAGMMYGVQVNGKKNHHLFPKRPRYYGTTTSIGYSLTG